MFGLRFCVCMFFFGWACFSNQSILCSVPHCVLCCACVIFMLLVIFVYTFQPFLIAFFTFDAKGLCTRRHFQVFFLFNRKVYFLCWRTTNTCLWVRTCAHTELQLTFHILICNFRNFEWASRVSAFFRIPRTQRTFLNVDGWRHRLWNSNLIKDHYSLCNHNENQKRKKTGRRRSEEHEKWNHFWFDRLWGWPHLIPLSSLS